MEPNPQIQLIPVTVVSDIARQVATVFTAALEKNTASMDNMIHVMNNVMKLHQEERQADREMIRSLTNHESKAALRHSPATSTKTLTKKRKAKAIDNEVKIQPLTEVKIQLPVILKSKQTPKFPAFYVILKEVRINNPQPAKKQKKKEKRAFTIRPTFVLSGQVIDKGPLTESQLKDILESDSKQLNEIAGDERLPYVGKLIVRAPTGLLRELTTKNENRTWASRNAYNHWSIAGGPQKGWTLDQCRLEHATFVPLAVPVLGKNF